MTDREHTSSPLRRAAWIAGAVVVASVLFAPLSFGGFCADAPTADASYCVTTLRSLVGLDTSLWLWLGAVVVLAGFAWWFSARRGRRR
ncbi:hypothetical protein IF188_10795 [Microbacterium sp. NEAU-LLC]|uniref:LPXTG cell wall anchor domain-containing protein n=1 Tax=Microbacterium helvum TaxID=2773713 RepID=A0ABR8NNE7_9MICO|nr:hypothetical protein [Microbacterium helvum]MBD3942185.1 hypothetical protein [Microbacterium helvum]